LKRAASLIVSGFFLLRHFGKKVEIGGKEFLLLTVR
jgi:hypothetical protein